MEDRAPKIDITSRLGGMDEAFALPQVLIEILQMVDSDQTTSNKLARVIMHDPNLTAKLLRMANSSYYRRGVEITTVNQSIMVLGVSMVKCLALSASIFEPDKQLYSATNFDIRELYSHFLGTAIAARHIAEETGSKRPEEAFIAGLLHDLGHLYLLKVVPERHVELLAEYLYDPELTEVERRVYGMDHAELGRMIAKKWNLPAALQSAIGQHHAVIDAESAKGLSQLDLTVSFADNLAGRVYADAGRNIQKYLDTMAVLSSALNLRAEVSGEVSLRLLNELMDAAGFLGIDIGDPMTIVQRANRQLFETYSTIESLFKERQELSRRIIEEEHRAGAIRSKDIAIATLSHYINNSATIISGRIQLLQLMLQSGKLTDPEGKLDQALKVIDTSLSKIMAVLSELKALSSLDNVQFYNDSDAINIDENIRRRMEQMDKEFGVNIQTDSTVHSV
jgi:putative nucleotidyltransferase with HDIG domain